MSHTSGQVIRNGDVLGWFEYNGTSDIAKPRIFASQDELAEHWRKSHPPPCDCTGEEVELLADYGDGIRWRGRACFEHHCITHNRIPEQYQDES